MKDTGYAALENLPDPDVLIQDIIKNLETGVERFKEILAVIE